MHVDLIARLLVERLGILAILIVVELLVLVLLLYCVVLLSLRLEINAFVILAV